MESVILALHGFRSSAQSEKIRILAACLTAKGKQEALIAPDLPPSPADVMVLCARLLADPLAAGKKVTLMGSSLGGYYATFLAERYDLQAVLLNPAVPECLSPKRWLGWQPYLHQPERGFEFTSRHLEELRALHVATPTPERYWLLLETGDTVLDYRDAAARYAGCRQQVFPGGHHGFSRFAEVLPGILAFAGL
ncbi:MAG: alpha/beta fold hydrolase [Zoogloeaceae bacterium]|jgi:predicted esterase YcpF (UPF0227 family)|nr:alpha/beta fold hydrolase [Zoogloeaceae bacterium]